MELKDKDNTNIVSSIMGLKQEIISLKRSFAESSKLTNEIMRESRDFQSRTLTALERLSVGHQNIDSQLSKLFNTVQGGDPYSLVSRMSKIEGSLGEVQSKVSTQLSNQREDSEQREERGWSVKLAVITTITGVLGSLALGAFNNFKLVETDEKVEQNQKVIQKNEQELEGFKKDFD